MTDEIHDDIDHKQKHDWFKKRENARMKEEKKREKAERRRRQKRQKAGRKKPKK